MRKKILIIGILTVLLILSMPAISNVQAQQDTNTQSSNQNQGSNYCQWLLDQIAYHESEHDRIIAEGNQGLLGYKAGWHMDMCVLLWLLYALHGCDGTGIGSVSTPNSAVQPINVQQSSSVGPSESASSNCGCNIK